VRNGGWRYLMPEAEKNIQEIVLSHAVIVIIKLLLMAKCLIGISV
jgi:hypothetical protein